MVGGKRRGCQGLSVTLHILNTTQKCLAEGHGVSSELPRGRGPFSLHEPNSRQLALEMTVTETTA